MPAQIALFRGVIGGVPKQAFMFPQVAGSIEIRYGAGTKTRQPNIVDLPEFAPVFPTTALFEWAFQCFERLGCRPHPPGDLRTPSEGELFVLVSGKEPPDSAARTRAG